MNEVEAKEKIQKLIDKYERIKASGEINRYNEQATKDHFIRPLFEVLGWDFEEEVFPEKKVSKGRVDYAFKLNGISKFFLEAKKLKENLDLPKWAEQAINYSWHKGVVWAILCDFEGLKVFNAEIKSKSHSDALFFSIDYTEYIERFDQLWLLSKDSIKEGLLDKEAEKWGKKIKKTPVDKQLLADLTASREVLSKDILKNNKEKNLSQKEIDECVQRILDRIIFIRKCEDSEIETKKLVPLLREIEAKGKENAYKQIQKVYREFDDKYNSKLFTKHLSDELIVSYSALFKAIYTTYLTFDKTIRYNFADLDADVLGNMYEQYLGHLLKSSKTRATLESGSKKRKEQGIYYTPTYVVKYIVENTLGELLKNKKIRIENLKVLDPACGSGSFLIKAFDFLVEKTKERDEKFSQTKLDGQGFFSKKLDILRNNLFGVDLDEKAVEIAQLNLLLKMAEKRHRLPSLKENLKCGNSLIQDTNLNDKKSFVWNDEFSSIMGNDGFDIIIGNPPYVNNRNLNDDDKSYFEEMYETAHQQYDLYVLFYELAFKLLKPGGFLGFITPNKFSITKYGVPLRKILLSNKIIKIVDVSQLSVFGDVSTYPYIVIIQKGKPDKNHSFKFYSPSDTDLNASKEKTIKQSDLKFDEPFLLNINNTESSILKKISGEEVIDIYRAKPTSKNSSEDGNSYVVSNREIEPYGILRPTNKINSQNEWKLDLPAIIMKKICYVPTATIISNENYVPINTVYVIHSKNKDVSLEYLLAILNSKLIGFYTRVKYATTAMRGGFIELRTFEIKSIPIKIISGSEQIKIIDLVKRLVDLKSKVNKLDGKETDEYKDLKDKISKLKLQIDEEIYTIYNIPDKEKEYINNSLK